MAPIRAKRLILGNIEKRSLLSAELIPLKKSHPDLVNFGERVSLTIESLMQIIEITLKLITRNRKFNSAKAHNQKFNLKTDFTQMSLVF